VNETLGDTFLDPDLEYLLVPSLRVSLDILATGLESKLIGSLHSACLLETIIRCSIILFNNTKMSAFVQQLEPSKTSLVFEAEVELNVGRTFLTFLELTVNIGAMLEPIGQVLFGCNIRVVQGAEPVFGL
jgi:hypothetical protein